ncbi:sigma-70 family RNA polymerase sigma factor [Cellulomonas sp. JH27-2]|uniref:RNA polymerase sigma factor n=1 Tax=Cellulomonas sp. JH27-2 TaxID=2774139 RepID=UPI00177EF030|nr:sigma-70 family RNA polymerase sigma factor [Cellulomonas sp. JH27-2]MBD8057446.1 sigma-70 family RNA polymerase sigma factor [Cellulomonas sp. JH27-2]
MGTQQPGQPDSISVSSDTAAAAFQAIWSAHSPRVHAYAMRHVDPDTAQEIVAETFLVAWRRLAEIPGEPLPWLIVVARNTIANAQRSHYRQRVLHDELARLASVSPAPAPGAEVEAIERTTMLRGLAALSAVDREALLLVTWDGLTPAQAAAVHGVAVATFQVRLHRARRRLAGLLDAPPADSPDDRSAADGGADLSTRIFDLARRTQ